MHDTSKNRGYKSLERAISMMMTSIGPVTLPVARSFLVVAQNEGMGVGDLADKIGSNMSTMSRHLLDLSESMRSGAPGYGVLTRTVDPGNLRAVMYTLSPKGKLLAANLLDILED